MAKPPPPPRKRHPLAHQEDETTEESAKRIRRERGPMPEVMRNRINAILITAARAMEAERLAEEEAAAKARAEEEQP